MATEFDAIYLQAAGGSLILGRDNSTATATVNGGVSLNVLTDTFEEDDSTYLGDLEHSKYYAPVKGKFRVKIEGPTASGVMYFYDLLQDYSKLPEKYIREQFPYPPILYLGLSNAGRLRSMTVTAWEKELQIEALKTIIVDIEYEREALIGSSISVPTYLPTTFTNVTKRAHDTFAFSGNFLDPYSFQAQPINALYYLYRMGTVIPSGFLLASNMPIVTISGGYFYAKAGLTGHTRQSIVNEDTNNAYSAYNASTTYQGVLATTPNSLNTEIISSGVVYGNGTQTAGLVNFGPNKADVFITYKTTFSGTFFDVGVKQSFFNVESQPQFTETGFTRLQHSPTPTTAYIGRLSGTYDIARGSLNIIVKGQNTVSGTLLIDRIVLQPTQEIYNTIKIDKTPIPSLNPDYPDTATTSGIIAFELLSSYTATPGTPKYPRASFSAYRSQLNSLVPTYRGNIDLWTKRSDITFPVALVTNPISYGYWNTTFLSTGSAFDTVSGMRYWTLTDTFNQAVKMTVDMNTTKTRTNV